MIGKKKLASCEPFLLLGDFGRNRRFRARRSLLRRRLSADDFSSKSPAQMLCDFFEDARRIQYLSPRERWHADAWRKEPADDMLGYLMETMRYIRILPPSFASQNPPPSRREVNNGQASSTVRKFRAIIASAKYIGILHNTRARVLYKCTNLLLTWLAILTYY